MPDPRNELPAPAALEGLVQQALDEARGHGADAAEAACSGDIGLSVNVRKGEIDTLEHHRGRDMGVTVYFGGRKGSASAGELSEQAVREAVQAACDIARYTSEDPANGLAPAERMAVDPPDLDLDHPWPLSADDAVELARDCEAAAVEADRRIENTEGAGVSIHRGLHAYGNSHGFFSVLPESRHGIHCVAVAGRGEAMQRDHWYSVARDPAALEEARAVGRQAAEHAVARLGAESLNTERVPVLFRAPVARGLVGHLVSAVRGSALYRQASFLVDSAGEQLFPAWLQMVERPHICRALGSTAFDAEGVATTESALVQDGVLQRYVLDSYSARRLGLETTANAGGVHNLEVSGGDEDFDALLRRMGRGVVVTELMGQGVNLVTGDYSRGAAGFWVENGAIDRPVQEITIAGHLRDLFAGIQAVGGDVDRRGNIRCGSILVEEMTVAGQ
ncbi:MULTISPECIES: metalloprotease PmbA [unclassified Halorhodospira]|uniref:metalloprotease PmbA n=1 Tax=unclassified Halorhodospira TaxID=2626748 RepID=UPI001EE9621B|nr:MULTISPECIES: metalloprotease PmbA [unclassified Halorhodospira]MCG5541076.1 metalloprotease PmbA [Halorhodospira sp. M39old]MCG5546155.1 metalloprotease PmbA [Halorhodospira sp. M38]